MPTSRDQAVCHQCRKSLAWHCACETVAPLRCALCRVTVPAGRYRGEQSQTGDAICCSCASLFAPMCAGIVQAEQSR